MTGTAPLVTWTPCAVTTPDNSVPVQAHADSTSVGIAGSEGWHASSGDVRGRRRQTGRGRPAPGTDRNSRRFSLRKRNGRQRAPVGDAAGTRRSGRRRSAGGARLMVSGRPRTPAATGTPRRRAALAHFPLRGSVDTGPMSRTDHTTWRCSPRNGRRPAWVPVCCARRSDTVASRSLLSVCPLARQSLCSDECLCAFARHPMHP
jgi:hypothetical protein